MKKYNGKYIKFLIIAGFLALLIVNAIVLLMEYKNYDEKMQILYQLSQGAKTEEEGLEQAVSILKGEQAKDPKKQQAILDSYGFGGRYQSVFKRTFYTNCGIIICLTVFIYIIYLLVILTLLRSYISLYKKSLEEVDQKIIQFLNGNYQKSEEDFCEEGVKSRLAMNMDSLASYINRMRQQSAAEKEETKSLVTDISHQLKTPVAALKTSFEVLNSKGLSQEEREEFNERCLAQLIRLEELVSALVNISRMETGMIQIHPIEACVYDTISMAVRRIYPDAEKKEIEISFEAEESLRELTISHDPKWISEAFINVLENAVKYSEEGKHITIRMIKMSTFLRIEFEDEGMGVNKTEQNKIFLRFYRGVDKKVQKETGSGVGLYLAREILERHQGTITVRTKREQKGMESGSCFVIQIPLDKE